jgi:TnpA family transposase
VKTVFLCEYLSSLELRQEVHEGLNVIESWNAANSFIFCGKGGEVAPTGWRSRRSRSWPCTSCSSRSCTSTR